MSTTLPSFVELMSSLGLDQGSEKTDLPTAHSRSSSHSSSSSSPRPPSRAIAHPRSRTPSISSQHEVEKRAGSVRRVARYSPYTPAIAISSAKRSSVSCTAEIDDAGTSARSTSRPSSPRLSRGSAAEAPTVDQCGLFDADLPESLTPISTYVRRRTPQTSPIATTFLGSMRDELPPSPSVPPTLPTLPFVLLPAPYSFAPSSDVTDNPLPEAPEGGSVFPSRRSYRPTGVRISARLNFRENRPYRITPVA